jgi:hypothetical protein
MDSLCRLLQRASERKILRNVNVRFLRPLPRQPGWGSPGFFLSDNQIADELLMKYSAGAIP